MQDTYFQSGNPADRLLDASLVPELRECVSEVENNETDLARDTSFRPDAVFDEPESEVDSQGGESDEHEEDQEPRKQGKRRPQFCTFCKTLQCKLMRHLSRNHKAVPEVAHLISLNRKSKGKANAAFD